jgi:hypothetical protein
MKLKNCLPLKIRQTVSAIYDDMDYWTGTDNEQLSILRDIVHKQNILINHLLEQTIIHEEVPSNPAGVYADKMSFQGWFDTAGEILEDMKQGEVVIVYNKDKDVGVQIVVSPWNGFSVDSVPEHYEKDIYVCMQDSPTREGHFSKLETTIGKHQQIINNFLNRK